jgi:spoIIIJ-associated protein
MMIPMEEKNIQPIVSRTAQEFFASMGIEGVSVEMRSGKSGLKESFVCAVSVNRDDSKILIGAHGVTLYAIQHLIQTILRKKSDIRENFSVDINNYWKEKYRLLEQDADDAAHEAIATGRPVHLRAMLPYERKIVHSALSSNTRVETESSGKGESRRVTVRPAPLI